MASEKTDDVHTNVSFAALLSQDTIIMVEESLPTNAITVLNKLKEVHDLPVFVGWLVLIFQWHHQYCASFIMPTLHLLFNP